MNKMIHNREGVVNKGFLKGLLTLALLVAAGWGAPSAYAQSELALGAAIPMADATRASVDGRQVSLSSLGGSRGTVVMFWSNECPWVSRYEERFLSLASAYAGQGFGFVLINSNDAQAFPKESSANSRQYAQPVTYLVDPSSELARAFGAERTPQAYVFNGAGQLVYGGTIDDSPGDPGNVQATYLKDALDAMLNGTDIAMPRTKAFGCTIRFQN
jgi:thiol-disulfide isomerase/thioredoxin